jgi:uncharacterized protein (UPF0305 family)
MVNHFHLLDRQLFKKIIKMTFLLFIFKSPTHPKTPSFPSNKVGLIIRTEEHSDAL